MTINLDGSPSKMHVGKSLKVSGMPRPASYGPLGADTFRSGVLAGPYSRLPAAGVSGRTYLVDDRPFTLYDNGSSWVRYQNGRLYDVPATEWSLTPNAGDASYVLAEGALKLTGRTDYLDEPILLCRNAPATPYSVTVKWSGSLIAVQGAKDNRTGVGYFGFRDSVSGKFITLAFMGFANGPRFFIEKWNATNAPIDEYVSNTNLSLDMMRWVKMSDDAFNLNFSVSSNGTDFIDLFTVAKIDFLQSPDQLIVGVYNQKVQLSIDSWEVSK